MPTFFKIHYPQPESDYDFTYLNGSLTHPYGLPGVNCSVCGEIWSGSRILPYECPPEFRGLKEITDGWPISHTEHHSLRERISDRLHNLGDGRVTLRPGDSFQPAELEIPSLPESDFLWGSIGSIVVSEKVKELLTQYNGHQVAFCRVKIKKVGTRKVELPAPVPSTGEPENLFNELPMNSDTNGVGPYYEMVVLRESGFPQGYAPADPCSGCGRDIGDNAARIFRMTRQMWNGESIFFFTTTLYVIVTEDVKQLLEDVAVTNVEFTPF